MAYSMRGLKRAAWSPQQDVDQAAAWEAENDPVQHNQRLLNEWDQQNNAAASINPQWARYFGLLDAKGARLASARANENEGGIASDPLSSYNDNDYFPNPALRALKKAAGL